MSVLEWVVIKVYIHFELIKLVFPDGNSNNLDTKKAYYALYLITARLYPSLTASYHKFSLIICFIFWTFLVRYT